MSASAEPGAFGAGTFPPGWGPPAAGRPGESPQPFGFLWQIPKPLLIAAVVVGFIVLWPVGLAVLAFLLGTGRIGPRSWRRRAASRDGAAQDCGWRAWRREETSSSGNRAFDEYRQDTLRRLEEEQRDFGAFLERLRFAKDKAEFDQFMAERRQRPPAPPQDQPTPQG
jgi:hypothetical protein